MLIFAELHITLQFSKAIVRLQEYFIMQRDLCWFCSILGGQVTCQICSSVSSGLVERSNVCESIVRTVLGFASSGPYYGKSLWPFVLPYTKQSLWELIFYWEKEKFSDLDVCSISICSNTSPRTNGKSLFSFTEFYLWKKFLCEKIATSTIHIVSSVNSDKPSQN